MVVVTGASGFLGAAVLRRLARDSHTAVAAVSRAAPPEGLPSCVRWIRSDLRELSGAEWRDATAEPIEAVAHLAAFTPKHAADRDRVDDVVASNVLGTQALLRSFSHSPRRLVFASTLDVYAPQAFLHPVTETSAIGPEGLYGASKLFGEALVAAYARSAGVEHLVVRLGHLYGPGEGRYAKLVPETIRRVIAGQAPRLVGDGLARRDLLYVDDAAEAIARAVALPLHGVTRINVASGVSHSVEAIVTTIAEQAGYRGGCERIAAPGTGASIAFDTTVMRRVLGDWTLTPLAEGIRREVDWFRARS